MFRKSLLTIATISLSFVSLTHAFDVSSKLNSGTNKFSPPTTAPGNTTYAGSAGTNNSLAGNQPGQGVDGAAAAISSEADAKKAQAEQESVGCIDRTKNAGLACATMSVLTGMDPGTGAMIETMITTQLPSLIGQLSSSGKSAAEQCKIQNDINKMVGIITGAKTVACVAMATSCKSTCSAGTADVQGKLKAAHSEEAAQQNRLATAQASVPPDTFTITAAEAEITRLTAEIALLEKARGEITEQNPKCSAYRGNLPIMLAQAGITAMNMLKAGQCSDALATAATATPISLTGSNVDCSNAAYASTNMVCICRNSPSDPMCAGLNGGPNYGGGAGGVAGSAVTPGLNKGEGEDGTEVGAAPKFEGTNGSNGMNASGGGGGLPGGSGGGGGLGGADGEGGAGAGFDKNVITGTAGGGGGMPGLSAVGGGGGGKGGGSGGGAGGGSGFDFKKYLPKGLFKNRGLAGMTVPSTDGITGPMGPSLWEKVTNRYQEKKSSLIQDK